VYYQLRLYIERVYFHLRFFIIRIDQYLVHVL